jgi:hypothetical protein
MLGAVVVMEVVITINVDLDLPGKSRSIVDSR